MSTVDRRPGAFVQTQRPWGPSAFSKNPEACMNLSRARARAFPLPARFDGREFTTACPVTPALPRPNGTPPMPLAASKAARPPRPFVSPHYGLPTLTTNCSNQLRPVPVSEKSFPLMIRNALAGSRCRSTRRQDVRDGCSCSSLRRGRRVLEGGGSGNLQHRRE